MTGEITKFKPKEQRQLKRTIVGSVIVVSVLLGLLISDRVQASVTKYDDMKATVEYVEQDHSDNKDLLPAKFEEEIFSVSGIGANEINVSDSKNIVGFVSVADAASVSENIKVQLQARGWAILSSGDENILSAQKASGKYRYVYVQLFQIEDKTSAVVTLS